MEPARIWSKIEMATSWPKPPLNIPKNTVDILSTYMNIIHMVSAHCSPVARSLSSAPHGPHPLSYFLFRKLDSAARSFFPVPCQYFWKPDSDLCPSAGSMLLFLETVLCRSPARPSLSLCQTLAKAQSLLPPSLSGSPARQGIRDHWKKKEGETRGRELDPSTAKPDTGTDRRKWLVFCQKI